MTHFWAKITSENKLGMGVYEHMVNVKLWLAGNRRSGIIHPSEILMITLGCTRFEPKKALLVWAFSPLSF